MNSAATTLTYSNTSFLTTGYDGGIFYLWSYDFTLFYEFLEFKFTKIFSFFSPTTSYYYF